MQVVSVNSGLPREVIRRGQRVNTVIFKMHGRQGRPASRRNNPSRAPLDARRSCTWYRRKLKQRPPRNKQVRPWAEGWEGHRPHLVFAIVCAQFITLPHLSSPAFVARDAGCG
jgi:hypothetical protein